MVYIPSHYGLVIVQWLDISRAFSSIALIIIAYITRL